MPDTTYRTCPLCEATCGLELKIEDGRVGVIRGDRRNVFSGGFICPKGTTLGRLHEDPDRLRSPRIRRSGDEWEEVSWAEAFAYVAARFDAVVAAGGRQASAVYLGNPNVHSLDNGLAVRPFVKALGTRNVFSASTVDQMPKHVSSGYMFGHPATIPVPDIDRADYLVILGANPFESNGSLATAPDWPGRLQGLEDRGGTLVVVDPRRTRTAELADRHLAIRPGTDAALLLAMINHLYAAGLVDRDQLAEHVNGLDEVATAVAAITPEVAAPHCEVAPEVIREIAEELAEEGGVVYGRIGTHTAEFGTLASWAVDVLNVLVGSLDRPGGAMFPKPAHLPPSRRPRPFETGRWRSRVRGLPEVMGELPAITLADEILTPGEGQVRALFVVGGNPVLTNPDSARLAEALSELELMVSVDPYLNETSRLADVILPPPSALERPHYDLAFTGLSVRNYAMFSPAVFPAEGPSEFEILVTLTAIVSGLGHEVDATALARAALEPRIASAASALRIEAEEIRRGLEAWEDLRLATLDLMLRTGAYGDAFGLQPDGISLATLAESPHGIDLGPLQSRLAEAISTPSGKVELAPPPIIADIPRLLRTIRAPANGSLSLVGRRQLRTANSWLANIEVLVRGREQCTLQVHPDDARRLGLDSGSLAEVTSEVGKVTAPVEITVDIRPGVVSLPYGWGHDADGARLSVAARHPGVNVNLLTSTDRFDPLSGNAALTAIPVAVAPATRT
jgi:anaerobic selenocysteine-containing dehydrogenase